MCFTDHRHKAPELYVPLTGPHGWRFGVDRPLTILPAHRPIWMEPFQPHLTKGRARPFLCLFVWACDVNDPAEVLALKQPGAGGTADRSVIEGDRHRRVGQAEEAMEAEGGELYHARMIGMLGAGLGAKGSCRRAGG
ncbi:MAG: hypothetical protein R3D56_00705 [Paracoccaceae bacterium]